MQISEKVRTLTLQVPTLPRNSGCQTCLSGHTTINSQLWKLGFAFSQSQHCYPQDVPCTLLIGIAQTYIPKAYVHLDFVGKVEIGLELDEGEHGPPIDLSLCYLLLTTLQETASENQGEGGKNL